jgi:molecular chaperone GrpE
MSAGHDRWADEADDAVGASETTGGGGPSSAAGDVDGTADADDVDGRRTGDAVRVPAAEGRGGAGSGAGGGTRILPDVAALVAQRDEYLGSLQRMKADFDNYRKRVARLQEEQAARAAGDLVRKLLPVLDNLDLAIAHLGEGRVAGAVSEEARALDQARAQLLDVLSKEGLERVDAAEVPFDPNVHDAVAHSEPATADAARRAHVHVNGTASASPGAGVRTPGPDGDAEGAAEGRPGVASVDEVLRAGYRWRGQVLRPAMVRVRG